MLEFKNTVINTTVAERRPEWCQGGDPDALIEQMRSGVNALVESDILPTEMTDYEAAILRSCGVVFGDLVPGDPIFRYARLPVGWRKEIKPFFLPIMVSIRTESGRTVGVVMLKNAWHDRKARFDLNEDFQRDFGLLTN